jgi:hypothetical protein
MAIFERKGKNKRKREETFQKRRLNNGLGKWFNDFRI